MHTIQLNLPDDLAQELAPYQEHLPELLELGLQVWKRRHQTGEPDDVERIRQVLQHSKRVTLPAPSEGQSTRIRHTPLAIAGKAVSEIVIEQRD